MIVGIGIDVVEISRIDELVARFGDRARDRVFTPGELAAAGDGPAAVASLAARFAAKEAAMKALGTGWSGGVGFREIEIERIEGGAPRLRLHGVAAEKARAMGAEKFHVSLTHTSTTAAAVVVLER
jgi:holo-[acyl-carrier protein] synthase